MILPVETRVLHGNDLYPLPRNYMDVVRSGSESSVEMARQMRVNACRQWMLPRAQIARVLETTLKGWSSKNPLEQERDILLYKGQAFVDCIRFFDEWYLRADVEEGFDPLFYDEEPLPTPDYHWDILGGWAMNPATLDVAPRGGAKSMIVRKAALLRMLSRSAFKVLYCTSSEKNATETAQIIRGQLYTNPRILKDWGPEMPGGVIRPHRGDAPTGVEWFQLTNGSQLVTYSVNSKMRGGRPRWFILDDPEYDPHATTSMAERRAYMHRLIFKVAMPMLMRADTSISWLATFVSKRHYAWLATETEPTLEDGKVIQRAKVAEFEYWTRRIIKACWFDEKGVLTSCWPHRWPVSDEQKALLKLDPSTVTLQQIKQRIGVANFNSEYMANPGSSEEAFFSLDEKKHGWWLLKSSVDDLLATEPTKSETVVKWMEGEEEASAKMCDFLAQLRLFITVDTSKTAKKDSDYKVATLMGISKRHDLFVLDTWAGQCQQDKLVQATFDMAKRWGCRLICPEAIDDGLVLERTMKNIVIRTAQLMGGMSNLPIVKGFNPGFTKKNSKISALSSRFEHGKIKLPFMWRMRRPWADLFDQIEGFNPDVEDGGLSNDDILDTISMSEFILASRIPDRAKGEEEEVNVLKMLERGDTISKDGIPLSQYLDLSALTGEQMAILAKARVMPNPRGSVV